MIAIGPMDLSGSIGVLGQADHPELIRLFDRISLICRKKNIPFFPATEYGNIKNLSDWIGRGTSMLALGWDIGHIVTAGRLAIDNVRDAMKKIVGKRFLS